MSISSVIGIDIGGTKTAIALVDVSTKEIRSCEVFPSRAKRGFPAIIEDVTLAIQCLRAADTIAVGLGIAGLVDRKTQRLVTLPNIPGAEGADPKSIITKRTGLPVTVTNDAQCFAYCEALLGAGRGEHVVVGVTMGTGVGGGIVIDGELFMGACGCAGEFGHMLLVPGSLPYESDDRRGDVEQFLSGTAMSRRCEVAKRPQDYLEGSVCSFMQPQVFREVAWLVTNLTHVLDPSIIIFGGSAGQALKPHLAKVKAELEHWMLPHVPRPKLAIGTLKHAAVLGAALRAALLPALPALPALPSL